ncbi:hypothetical protein ACWGQ5_38560 [Streptomyces sp. NPDC055722]
MIIKSMHEMGIRSEHAYLAGLASIGLSIASWITSLQAEPGVGVDRADRWGIFVGEWAPTFFGLGLALSHYEQQTAPSPPPASTNSGNGRRPAEDACARHDGGWWAQGSTSSNAVGQPTDSCTSPCTSASASLRFAHPRGAQPRTRRG